MGGTSYQIGAAAWGLRETPLEAQFALCRELGLQQLEISIANGDGDFLQTGASAKDCARVRELSAQYGIGIKCAATGNDFTVPDYPQQVEKVKDAIRIAHECGCQFLRIFAGFSSDSVVNGTCLSNMLDSLRICADYAAQLHLTLAVETHGGVNNFGNAIMHVASITTRANTWPPILATGCKMLYDPANLDAVGQADPVAFYRKFAADIAVIHLKDFKAVPGGWLPAACGEGGLNYPELLNAISAFTGPVLLEYENPEDVADGFRRSLKVFA